MNVPGNASPLRRGVSNQRVLAINGKLSSNRRKLLDEIGFVWN